MVMSGAEKDSAVADEMLQRIMILVQELLMSTSIEGRWKWTMLSRKDHKEGGEEKAVKRPGEKERLTLEPSLATSNSMGGPEVVLFLVLGNRLLELREYWLMR